LEARPLLMKGLEVKELGLMINYDAPNHYEDYCWYGIESLLSVNSIVNAASWVLVLLKLKAVTTAKD
nr:hypothetical protein [Tanacetum cinerariifolium]